MSGGSTVARSGPWLRSPGFDWGWLLSGIWLVPVVVLLSRAPAALNSFLVSASLLLWLSHRFATAYSAFCMADFKDLVKFQPKRFVGWPVALLAAPFVLVWAPQWLVPMGLWEKAQVMALGFFLFNTYHFGMQHYGVLSIYRVRAGQDPAGRSKGVERHFSLLVGGLLVAIGQIGHGAEVVSDAFEFSPPGWVGWFGSVRVVAVALVLLATVVALRAEWAESKASLPKAMYITGLGMQGVLAYFLTPVAFLALWGIQHWLVSVALAGVMSENSEVKPDADEPWYSFWKRAGGGFWRTVGVLVVLSVLLSPLFEFATHPYKAVPQAVQGLKDFVEQGGWHSFWVALAFGTVYLHFAMDRAVFRFSDPEVRKVTGRLIFK